MELVREVYSVTARFPKNEEYALSSQLRRAAVSIPSNIAEGSKRSTKKDFLQFLHIASGSAAELETQLLIGKEEYSRVNCMGALSLLDEVQRLLNGLATSLRQNTKNY